MDTQVSQMEMLPSKVKLIKLVPKFIKGVRSTEPPKLRKVKISRFGITVLRVPDGGRLEYIKSKRERKMEKEGKREWKIREGREREEK